MSKKTISFVSTRGRGLNTDLQLVKDNLMAALPEVEFEYYLNKTATKIPLINTKMEDARRTFCTEAQNIICMDPSIPIKIPSASERERRLLLATPFDYQFNIFMKYHDNPDQPKKQTFLRCTHVMLGSPFTAKLFHSFYEWEDSVTFLDGIPLPISWDILQDNFNLKKIMDYIDDDWFVITNNWDLVELSYQLPYQYSSKFGYIKNKISLNDMMYLSDMLITNSSKHAGNFSITKKPIYYLEYLPKIFGNFIKKFYPSMYLKDLDQLLTLDFSNTELSPEQKNFCQEFSYDPTENPSETIEKLFKY